MQIKLTQSEMRRLEHCKKTGFDIWNGRKSPASSEIYFHWCHANNQPHILIQPRKKYARVSMDLPNVSGWPGHDSIHTEQFHKLCRKYNVPWTGALSVSDLQKKDLEKFSGELLDIGLAFCSEYARQKNPAQN